MLAGVIGDGFGHVERGVFAALATATGHIVGAHLAFGNHASFDSAEYKRQLKEAF